MAKIQNDDLLLVNSDREGHDRSYAIDGDLFKKEFGSIFIDDNSPPIIDFVELEERTPNTEHRFENETFDFRTTMIQPGDPLPGYGLKASVGGALYEDVIITDKIIDVEGGGINHCETDPIQNVSDPTTITEYEYRAARGSGTVADVFKSWNQAEASEIVNLGSKPTDSVNNTFYYIGFADRVSQIEIERSGTATNYEAWLYGTNDPDAGNDATLSGWTKLDYKYT